MKFKVGDKVRVIKKHPSIYCDIGEESILRYGVCNNEINLMFFYVNTQLKDSIIYAGFDANFYADCIELVDPINEKANVNDRKAVYDDNLNILYSHKEPLKPEDLKVGMVFESNSNETSYKYHKIFNIINEQIFCYILSDREAITYDCCAFPKKTFLNKRKLINKVPPKEIEVEEEVSVVLYKELYQKLKIQGYLLSTDLVGYGDGVFLNIGHQYIDVDKYVELCKIKRPVKKLVEFNWSTGRYE